MTRVLGVLGLLVALYAALYLTDRNALTAGNLSDVANLQGRFGVLTLAAALVIIVGGIDLSLGSVVGFAAVLFGALTAGGVHPFAALPLVLLAGAVIGLGNGLMVSGLRLQPFLVTLCGMFIYRGAARMVAKKVSTAETATAQPQFQQPIEQLQAVLIGVDEAGVLRFPAQFVLLLVLAAAVGFVLHGTAYGRYWYAIGYNELAARYAGVNVGRQRVAVYALCSTLAALGGVLLFLDSPAIQSDSGGANYELYAILGAVLGGCSLRGGEGTAVGMVLGAMVLPVLQNLVTLRGATSDVIPAIIGLTLLFGTLVDELVRRRSRV